MSDIVEEARALLKQHSRIHAMHDSDPAKDVDVAGMIGALADEVERLRKQLVQSTQDARHDAQAAADEAYWRDKQGDEYGSY